MHRYQETKDGSATRESWEASHVVTVGLRRVIQEVLFRFGGKNVRLEVNNKEEVVGYRSGVVASGDPPVENAEVSSWHDRFGGGVMAG